jgi:hypothetical protein
MKLKLTFLTIGILICQLSTAQNNYKTALGLRAVPGAGFTVKHNLNSKASIEGILGTRWRGVHLTGLYQVNYPVFTEPGFRFYMGAGAHIGFWNGRYNPWWDEKDESHAVFGIDGQIGLEYTFNEIPLNLSVDWKPAINLVGSSNFWGDEFGLSIRYAIK